MTWTEQEQDAALEVKLRVIRHRARYHALQDWKARPGLITWDPAPNPYGHVHVITAREARRARWSRLAPWWWGIMGTPTTGGPHGQ